MIHLERFIDTPIPDRAQTLPQAAQTHLDSLHDLVGELVGARQIDSPTAVMLHHHGEMHDEGYAWEADDLQSEPAQNILQAFYEGIGVSLRPKEVSDYLRQHRGNPLVTKIIAHALVGFPRIVGTYTDSGLPNDKALGMAVLLGAHQPGYPIDMVANEALPPTGVIIPSELREPLLIDIAGQAPEKLRRKMIAFGAEKLGISHNTAATFAVLGYALDRMTPGRKPDKIRLIGDEAKAMGGEVIDKKYGLAAGDLLRMPGIEPTIALLFSRVDHVLHREVDSAITAADTANLPEVAALVTAKSADILSATTAAQTNALGVLQQHGLNGSFRSLKDEQQKLLEYLKGGSRPDPDALFALAAYQKAIQLLPADK